MAYALQGSSLFKGAACYYIMAKCCDNTDYNRFHILLYLIIYNTLTTAKSFMVGCLLLLLLVVVVVVVVIGNFAFELLL